MKSDVVRVGVFTREGSGWNLLEECVCVCVCVCED